MKVSTQLKLGEMCASTGEIRNSLVNVVNMTLTALFGKKKGTPPSENVRKVSTADEIQKAFNELMS